MTRPAKKAGVHLRLTPPAAAKLRSALLALERHLESGLAVSVSSGEQWVVREVRACLSQPVSEQPLTIAVPEDL